MTAYRQALERDPRFLPMPFHMEALKIADSIGIRKRVFLPLMLLAMAAALAGVLALTNLGVLLVVRSIDRRRDEGLAWRLHPQVREALGLGAGIPQEDLEVARRVLATRSRKDAVDADWARSRAYGVTGVPTFVAGRQGVVGAQPYETLVQLIESAK
mgnify:CR=1 FL=1